MIQIRDFRTLKVEHDPGMSESVIFERGNSNVVGINCPPGWNRVTETSNSRWANLWNSE